MQRLTRIEAISSAVRVAAICRRRRSLCKNVSKCWSCVHTEMDTKMEFTRHTLNRRHGGGAEEVAQWH